jgi:Na+/H+ antiporter NhaC
MVMALLILTLAWSLGGICKGDYLQTGDWVISLVNPPAALLPMITFLAACLIAFATGTSWGTMAIIIPIAVPLAWAQTPEESIRLATVGAVLTGAVFGDHCSPISDTTVMSSVAAASDHLDHVRTQAPYALLCAGVASVVGFLPAGLGVPPWISLPAGAVILVAFLRFFGRPCDIKES